MVKGADGKMVFAEADSQSTRDFAGHAQEILYDPENHTVQIAYEPVRPIPDEEVWFERIYQQMRREKG